MDKHNDPKLDSLFVRLVMPDASEEEIEAVSKRWFDFLLLIDRIACRIEREHQGARADAQPSADQ